jgi:hypothetical protein
MDAVTSESGRRSSVGRVGLSLVGSPVRVFGLEVELVDIVLREPERIPQHDHVLQRERTLGCDASSDATASRVPNRPAGTLACVALSVRVPARLA